MIEVGSGLLCFLLFFGAAMMGALLHPRLPPHHRDDKSHDVVRNSANILVLASSVLLAFLITFMQSSFEKVNASTQGYGTEITVLDNMLRSYGPKAEPMRQTLEDYAKRVLTSIWSPDGTPDFADRKGEALIQKLSVAGLTLEGRDHFHQALASELVNEIRLLALRRQELVEFGGSELPVPFIVLTIVWLTLSFASFGFNAPCNVLTVGSLFITTLSIAAALYLIIDLGTPFGGPIKVSDWPVRTAILHLQRPILVPK